MINSCFHGEDDQFPIGNPCVKPGQSLVLLIETERPSDWVMGCGINLCLEITSRCQVKNSIWYFQFFKFQIWTPKWESFEIHYQTHPSTIIKKQLNCNCQTLGWSHAEFMIWILKKKNLWCCWLFKCHVHTFKTTSRIYHISFLH